MSSTAREQLLHYVDVYIDDFVILQQGSRNDKLQAIRNLFHCIDRFLRPNDDADAGRQEPNSLKKLWNGDAFFSTCKKVLGWIFHNETFWLQLTERRRTSVLRLLDDILAHPRRCAKRKWESLLGTIRSLCMGIPGGR